MLGGTFLAIGAGMKHDSQKSQGVSGPWGQAGPVTVHWSPVTTVSLLQSHQEA